MLELSANFFLLIWEYASLTMLTTKLKLLELVFSYIVPGSSVVFVGWNWHKHGLIELKLIIKVWNGEGLDITRESWVEI
jgi:hypothetical protein